MVINLARRPERLGRFLEAVRTNEPWLLESGRMCRVEGRDGKELPQKSTRFERPGDEGVPDAKRPVIHSLRDTVALVRDGWVTAEALDTSGSRDRSFWPNMTAGGLGLYLGHAAAWQHILSAGLDYGIVFEDDLTLFSPTFRDNVSAALAGHSSVAQNASGTHASWDLLYLQRCDDPAWSKERVWQKSAMPTGDHTARIVQLAPNATITCTGAYVLTREGALKLLEGALPARLQLDAQLGRVPGLVRAALSPPVAQCQEVFKNKIGGSYRDTDVQNKGDNVAEVVSNLAAAMDNQANKWLKDNQAQRSLRGPWKSAAESVLRGHRRGRRRHRAELIQATDFVPSCGA